MSLVRRPVVGPLLLLLAGASTACDDGRASVDAGFFRTDSGAADAGRTDGGRTDAGVPTSIQVQAVFDGDTVRVAAASSQRTPDDKPMSGETIRFLGIDAPEIAHAPAPADCWGDQSHARARDLLLGRTITLEYDIDSSCPMPVPASRVEDCHLRDAFGRLLAYVIIADGSSANETFVREGHARSFRAFPHRKTALFNQLESEARNADRGLWSCP